MNSQTEHIFKGIGWYMYNGDFIEKNAKNIIFVGSVENMNNDLKKLQNILNTKFLKKKIRKNTNINDKYLSAKAIKNIKIFYKYTDYKALETFLKYKFITKDLFEKYHYYNIN